MKLTSAGESHGKGLIGIIENVPSNLIIDIDNIDKYLALRQSGYGRGARQKIEKDKINILSGVRNKKTLGSPLSFMIENKDYLNWKGIMAAEGSDDTLKTVTKVRPGHADLTGLIKYNQTDARNILERASARETTVRVAAGSIARCFLNCLNIEVAGYVKEICGIADDTNYLFNQIKNSKNSDLFVLNNETETAMKAKIDILKNEGDTAGGVVEIRVKGLKSGFGSSMQYDKKLDSKLAAAIISIQAAKGVEFGIGFDYAKVSGKSAHDEIYYDNSFKRYSNNAGGIEGGMSNGEDIILKAVMKPIPTLMSGLRTVDFLTKQKCTADTERSDVTAVPAFEIIVESVVCLTLAEVILQRLGGDNMEEIVKRWKQLP
jgi:chorismate synthase